MAANIDRIAYTGQIPWHGLGTKIDHYMTWKEAVVAAGLNWRVEKAPVMFNPKVVGDVVKAFEGQQVTYRSDNGVGLGIVSDGYTVVQNEDLGRVLDAVVGEAGAHYEVAGSLGKGERVWALIKLPGILRAVGDDVIEKYLLCANGHDGSLAFWVIETAVRVVCENTLTAAINARGDKAFRLFHTADMVIDVDAIRAKLGYAADKFDVLEQAYQKMAATPVSAANNDEAAKDYFKKVIEYPELVKKALTGEGKENLFELVDEASSRMQNRLSDMLNLLETGKGAKLPGVQGTAWGLFNAVTAYADYFNGKSDAGRAQSTLFGAGAQMKARAFDEAVLLGK